MLQKVTILIVLLSIFSCKKGKKLSMRYENNLPKEGNSDVIHPEDNLFSKDRYALGKLLFYDPILSLDSSISCNSCHKQEFAFGDNVAISPGVEGRLGNRNSPSLANVAVQPYFTREGGVPSLEQHVLVPIQEHTEMAFNILDAAERMAKVEKYQVLCEKAYPGKPIYFAITASVAQFQRSLLSINSPFDAYLYKKQEDAISENAKRGMALFYSNKANCYQCHSGTNFTTYNFENNGLYSDYLDKGRYGLTKLDTDLELFKIPSLRNVSITGPYMHDGSIQTLEEVIEHYNLGGKVNNNKSSFIRPLNLTQQDKDDLVAFLNTLTDREFIENEKLEK